ncbi:nickel-dependent hydrogenase large subunit, partial [Candidatus Bathyarchaeota archaeon]|nr:nickel-dependent hydrogenase large subunit [Candidatus Bathyarchaeota archaeon]
NYMALTKDSAIEFYDGNVKIINPDGEVQAEFPYSRYLSYIEEKRYGWTYAKFAYLKGVDESKGIVQVGPTPRMNVNDRASTEMADAELKEFKRKFGSPTHTTILFDYARLIELLYACERAKELLEDDSITRENVRVNFSPRRGIGIGVVEAPRGTLAHQYILNEHGRLEELKLIIPTQVNNAAINVNVKDAASEFIHKGVIKPGLLNRIEMVVRAYDPCIKCAARTVGDYIKVDILDYDGRIIKTTSR